jgi:hypothetical protein
MTERQTQAQAVAEQLAAVHGEIREREDWHQTVRECLCPVAVSFRVAFKQAEK